MVETSCVRHAPLAYVVAYNGNRFKDVTSRFRPLSLSLASTCGKTEREKLFRMAVKALWDGI